VSRAPAAYADSPVLPRRKLGAQPSSQQESSQPRRNMKLTSHHRDIDNGASPALGNRSLGSSGALDGGASPALSNRSLRVNQGNSMKRKSVNYERDELSD
jgi:hypothetical protein